MNPFQWIMDRATYHNYCKGFFYTRI